MIKPGLVQRAPYLNYFDVVNWIEKKYKVDIIWHWMIENAFYEVRNDTFQYLGLKELIKDKDTPEVMRVNLKLIETEFEEYLDKDGGLEFFISW